MITFHKQINRAIYSYKKTVGMRPANLVDFSNIYSKKSQQLLSKGRNIISNLSKTQRFSPDTLKKSKSPRASKTFVTNIPNIEDYRHQSKLTFTDQRINHINKRLEIDAIISQNFERRMKDHHLYIDDTNNPFSQRQQQQFAQKTENQKVSADPKRNVLTELAMLKDKTSKQNIKKRLSKEVSPLKSYILNLQKQQQRKKDGKRNHDKGSINTFSKTEKIQINTIVDPIAQFDALVNSKEESFFNKNNKSNSWNIFNLIKNKTHIDFRCGKEILQTMYYSLDSIVSINFSKKKKLTINFMQQISSFMREIVCNPNKKNKFLPQRLMIVSGDLRPSMEQLQFEDIMLIATSRLSNSVLLKYFREEDFAAKQSQLIDEEEKGEVSKKNDILYDHNTKNKKDNYSFSGHQKTEIGYYENAELSQLEKQQQRLSKTFQKKYKKVVEEEMTVLSQSIKDDRVFQKINKKKNGILLEQLESNADHRLTSLMKEVERKIRINKISKNKTEKIKIDELTETLKMKKNIQRSLTKKTKYSPLNTWR